MGCKRKIGIFGGTFDPIHSGHLIMAELVRERYKLDRVLFIPSGNPPHKDSISIAPAQHRNNMVGMATRSNPNFETLSIEIDRGGYTYSIDTLEQLKKIYSDSSLYFIIGADVVFDLLTWKKIEEVFKVCEFIAVLRPGFQEESFLKRIRYLEENYSAVIHSYEVPQIDISSTSIRERVSEGKSIKYLVPECVEEYIMNEKIYSNLEMKI